MGQDANWDLRNYHYYNAYSFLNARLDIDIGPAQIQTYINPLLDLPYYFIVTTFSPQSAGFILGAIHGLNFYLTFLIAFVIFQNSGPYARVLYSISCAALGMYSAAGVSELGTCLGDNTVSLFALASVLVLTRAQITRISSRALHLSGFILGLGIGLKYTLVYMFFGIGTALFLLPGSGRDKGTAASRFVAATAFGIIATAGHWFWALWIRFENPLFPFFNTFFKSPWHLFQTPLLGWYPHAESWTQTIFLPFYLLGYNKIGAVLAFREGRFAVIYVLFFIAAVLFLRRKRQMTSLSKLEQFLISLFIAGYLFWQVLFGEYRYLVPLDMLGPIVITILLKVIIENRRITAVATGITFLCLAYAMSYPNYGRLRWQENFMKPRIPQIENLDQSIVILAGNDASSYLIPSFPSKTQFIRVQSQLTDPNHQTQMQSKIRRTLAEHNKDVYLLEKDSRMSSVLPVIEKYGFILADGDSFPVKTRYRRYEWQLALRQLTRVN